jgi:phosphoglycerate dehydrogenase-like enzyme
MSPDDLPLRVFVLGRPDDPSLSCLREPQPGVTFTIGSTREAFAGSSGADVIVVAAGGRALLEQVWPLAPSVRWVHTCTAGIEHVLFPALAESPVPLTNARGVFSRALAEFAIAGLLFFAKDLRRMLKSQAAGLWDPFDLDELHGRTLGIVGYGDIGRAVADRARAFGMRILALRRRPEKVEGDAEAEVVPLAKIRELFARSDAVVVATPLTRETRGLVGAAEIAALPRHAVVVNLGRGAAIDEAALAGALASRRIGGAVLDVFETEPLPAGHVFYRLDNVLLSPHCADHTHGWRESAVEGFLDNLGRFRRGEPLRNVVDKAQGY